MTYAQGSRIQLLAANLWFTRLSKSESVSTGMHGGHSKVPPKKRNTRGRDQCHQQVRTRWALGRVAEHPPNAGSSRSPYRGLKRGYRLGLGI